MKTREGDISLGDEYEVEYFFFRFSCASSWVLAPCRIFAYCYAGFCWFVSSELDHFCYRSHFLAPWFSVLLYKFSFRLSILLRTVSVGWLVQKRVVSYRCYVISAFWKPYPMIIYMHVRSRLSILLSLVVLFIEALCTYHKYYSIVR